MPCDCVKEGITVLQQQNKTLRTANKHLREQLQLSRLESDYLFMKLCETDSKLVELFQAVELDTDINELTALEGGLPN